MIAVIIRRVRLECYISNKITVSDKYRQRIEDNTIGFIIG